jgi:hypothetical protein
MEVIHTICRKLAQRTGMHTYITQNSFFSKKFHQFRPYTISSIPLFHQFRPTQISDLKSNCNPQNQISNPIANPQNQAVKSMTVLAMGSAQHVTLKKTPGHSALRRRTDAKCITRDTTAINKQQSNQSKSIKINFKSKPNQNNHFTHTLSTHTWNRCNALTIQQITPPLGVGANPCYY